MRCVLLRSRYFGQVFVSLMSDDAIDRRYVAISENSPCAILVIEQGFRFRKGKKKKRREKPGPMNDIPLPNSSDAPSSTIRSYLRLALAVQKILPILHLRLPSALIVYDHRA